MIQSDSCPVTTDQEGETGADTDQQSHTTSPPGLASTTEKSDLKLSLREPDNGLPRYVEKRGAIQAILGKVFHFLLPS